MFDARILGPTQKARVVREEPAARQVELCPDPAWIVPISHLCISPTVGEDAGGDDFQWWAFSCIDCSAGKQSHL